MRQARAREGLLRRQGGRLGGWVEHVEVGCRVLIYRVGKRPGTKAER